jgi:hypothetical protein
MEYVWIDSLETPPQFRSSPEEEARLKEQAKTFPVKRLAYRGEHFSLKFDRRTRGAFKRKRMNTSSDLGAANLSYSDFESGMHITFHATASEMRLKFTPEFSKSDEELKLVIAQQGYSYALMNLREKKAFYGGKQRVPNGFVLNRESLETLVNQATTTIKNRDSEFQGKDRHVIQCEKHGGYLALRTAIAYKSWRLYKDCTSIAEEMGLSPVGVRQILCRLCQTARRLELETFPRHHSCFHDMVRPLDAPRNHRSIDNSARRRLFNNHGKPNIEPEIIAELTKTRMQSHEGRMAAAGYKVEVQP